MRFIKKSWLPLTCLFLLFNTMPTSVPVYAQEDSAEQVEGELIFDFGEVDTEALQSAERPAPPGLLIFYILPAILFIIVLFLIFKLWLGAKGYPRWKPFFLGDLPPSFKLLITIYFSVYGLVHVVALINVYIQTRIVYPSVEEYFFYMPIQKLTGTTHAHLFGLTTMYALTSVVFMFTSAKERLKIPVIAAAFLGAPFDLYSWWLIKFLGEKYEIMSAFSGGTISTAFLIMYGFVVYELWFKKNAKQLHQIV